MIKHIESEQEFEEFIKEGNVVIDLFATWCGPCRMMTPVLEDIDNEYEGKLKIGKVDVDALGEIAAQYMVSSIPTLLFIKDGELKHTQVGFMPQKSLKHLIDNNF